MTAFDRAVEEWMSGTFPLLWLDGRPVWPDDSHPGGTAPVDSGRAPADAASEASGRTATSEL